MQHRSLGGGVESGGAGSGNLAPHSGLHAPILGILEVQSCLVSQNSGPRL